MNAPSGAASVTLAASLSFVMVVFKTIPSNGSPFALAVDYIRAVRKDIGLNIPEIHNDFGGIISS